MGGAVPEYKDLEGENPFDFSKKNDEIEKKYKVAKFESDANDLFTLFPPNIQSFNKKILGRIMMKEMVKWEGLVKFSRYFEMSLPKAFPDNKVKYVVEENVYTYERVENKTKKKSVEWHVNFADKHLFGYYGGGLFAQDEIQTAEMPILGSVREYLIGLSEVEKEKNPELVPLTRNKAYSSPCLIKNVQRRLTVAMDPNKELGRPYGLYGNAFARGSEEAIKKATTIFKKPELQNILAMEAPKGNSGAYSKDCITFVLKTAFTGFIATVCESNNDIDKEAFVVVHSGNWGTGAYGGNKVLMALLQIAAAKLSGIDVFVFHSFKKEYTEAYTAAKKIFDDEVIGEGLSVKEFIKLVESKKFQWGVSDGN